MSGAPLQAFIRTRPDMISDSVKALMVKRGASSMMERGPAEYGPEETSRGPAGKRSVVLAPLFPVEKMGDTEMVSEDLSTRDRKRLRRDGEGASRVRIKRPRDVLPSSCDYSGAHALKQKEVEVPLEDGKVIGLDAAMKTAKKSFDQVLLFTFLLIKITMKFDTHVSCLVFSVVSG